MGNMKCLYEALQTITRERFGRELTKEEMRVAIRCLENGINWGEVAAIAVFEAVEVQE